MKRSYIVGLASLVAAGLGLLGAQVAQRLIGDAGLLSERGRAPAERFAYGNVRPGELPEYWPVPNFSLPNQQGTAISAEGLRGHVWIADFFFTTCTSVCPLLTSKLVRLQRHLPEPELRYISFSVDPAHDTLHALKEYAQRWAPEETRWQLLATTKDTLSQLAEGMRVAVEAQPDVKDPILHSSMFFLVDVAGKVRGIYDSNDDTALQRLEQDALSLLGKSTRPEVGLASTADGRALFETLKCAACHDSPALSPALAGLKGRSVSLSDGATLVADAEYVRESITDPGKKQVSGFLNIMPAYRGELSEAQLSLLTDYVLSLAAPSAVVASAAAASATTSSLSGVVVDPVCGMDVRVVGDTPRARHDGHEYAFCSESCAEQFRKNPAAFVKATKKATSAASH